MVKEAVKEGRSRREKDSATGEQTQRNQYRNESRSLVQSGWGRGKGTKARGTE